MKKITLLLFLLTLSIGYAQELVTNGDFQTGAGAPWYNGALNVVDLGSGTWVNQANVLVAGNPWDANISQDIILENGKTYELSYDAWTDATTATRTMIVGLGQNGPGWASLTETPALTDTPQTFTHQFTINYGDAVADRVIFDMGAATGFVFIDNVSVMEFVPDPTTDVTLSDLTVDGTTVSGFSAGTLTYDIELSAGTTVVPAVVGTPTQSSPATAVTTDAGSLPGTSTVLVTAQDGSTTETYTLNFTVAVPITPPTVAAPTPPVRDAADVVSIFSDAYATISPINYDEAWCGAGAVTATTAGGDNVFAYNGQPCQGIGFASDIQDVTGLTNMHVDLFIAIGTDLVGKVFNVKIVYSAGGETSFNIDINALDPVLVPGTWYSYDALVSITGSNIQQVGITSNLNNVVWYDNLYFWKTPVDPLTDITLSNLTVDGTTVDGFSEDTLTYDIELSAGTTVVPAVVGTPTQSSPATAVTTNAVSLPGTSTVLVTAQDGSTTETYTLNFTINTNTDCAGTSSESQQGSFSNGGYSYAFETLGNGDVRMTFELLEAGAVGIVAYSWKETPFQELPMTVTGSVASIDLAGYTTGDDISHAVKFAWAAGGFGVTKYFTYTVGDDCGATAGINDYEIEGLNAYPNPTNDRWTISTKNETINSIEIFNVLGKRVISLRPNLREVTIDASNLATGMYFSIISTDAGTGTRKLIKK